MVDPKIEFNKQNVIINEKNDAEKKKQDEDYENILKVHLAKNINIA